MFVISELYHLVRDVLHVFLQQVLKHFNSLQSGDLENTTKDLFSKTKNKQLQKNSKKRTQTKDVLTGWQEPDPAGSKTLNQKKPE